MYSIQQTPEAQFVTLQPEVPNVTPQRPSSSSASASLATMWNETGTTEVNLALLSVSVIEAIPVFLELLN